MNLLNEKGTCPKCDYRKMMYEETECPRCNHRDEADFRAFRREIVVAIITHGDEWRPLGLTRRILLQLEKPSPTEPRNTTPQTDSLNGSKVGRSEIL